MATQVVVMAPVAQGQTQNVQQTGGETFNTGTQPAGQTVVVVQQQPAGQTQPQGDRFPRWPFLIFGIGMSCYHFIYMIFFLAMSIAASSYEADGYGSLFFFCGALPSIIAFIWMINDSTVFCANPGTGDITKICCCDCVNGYAMAVPMAIAALLRCILWISFFGILADILNSVEADSLINNVFWMILSLGAFDVGPLVLCAIDWWWYYGKRDYNGLFGHKLRPLRCITGESIVIMIISWALIAVFEEYADDAASVIWPWILHGILSTVILVFAAFLQFSGSITGPMVSNTLFKFVCWGLGIAQAILILIVWGYVLSWAFGWGTNWSFALLLFIYGVYYSGMTVPVAWALFSIKVAEEQSSV